MRTIAILAPPFDGIPPEKYERARMAMLEQMMLLARGFPTDHPAVRAAAEIVGSAIAADPLEFAISATGRLPSSQLPPEARRDPVQRPTTVTAKGVDVAPLPEPKRHEVYSRYLTTILSTQPVPSSAPRKARPSASKSITPSDAG